MEGAWVRGYGIMLFMCADSAWPVCLSWRRLLHNAAVLSRSRLCLLRCVRLAPSPILLSGPSHAITHIWNTCLDLTMHRNMRNSRMDAKCRSLAWEDRLDYAGFTMPASERHYAPKVPAKSCTPPQQPEVPQNMLNRWNRLSSPSGCQRDVAKTPPTDGAPRPRQGQGTLSIKSPSSSAAKPWRW